ncbi:hypothetical protein [Thauera terpenica]|uniref:hypothetical protein n=1 Tax=Thauera terpenica TaxID=76113 RepID=UPI0012FA0ED1|nr:hypothetical protein [Thauera terpenica]
MNPIYAARIAKVKAESTWRAVDRNQSSTMEQRTTARKAYEQAKANYRAAFKRVRSEA